MNIEKGKQGKKTLHGEFERKTRRKAVSPICIQNKRDMKLSTNISSQFKQENSHL